MKSQPSSPHFMRMWRIRSGPSGKGESSSFALSLGINFLFLELAFVFWQASADAALTCADLSLRGSHLLLFNRSQQSMLREPAPCLFLLFNLFVECCGFTDSQHVFASLQDIPAHSPSQHPHRFKFHLHFLHANYSF